MDGSIRVCALEYITSAYQHVYSGFYQSWSSFCLHTAIYLNECLASALFDELAQTAYLLDGVLDEFLSAEAWVNAHQKHHVYIADDVFQHTYRGRRVEGNSCLHACCMNLLDGAVQMSAGLVVHVHHHGTELGSLLNVIFRVLYHKVDVEGLGAHLAYGFYHREAERDVGHEDTIHHIEVEPVGLTLVNHLYITLQVNEVG